MPTIWASRIHCQVARPDRQCSLDGQGGADRDDLSTELLRAWMPTPDELRMLELNPGVPVVQVLHIDYGPDGRTLQVADDLYAADRDEFAFEWSEPGEAT